MKILLSTAEKKFAHDKYVEIKKHVKALGYRYTNLAEPEAFLTGLYGEIAFDKLLKTWGVPYEWRLRTDGKDDGGDFLIGGIMHDVKTASRPGYRYMMMPQAQFSKLHRDRYIGARLEGDCVNFMGWLTRAELAARPVFYVKVPTVGALFTELRTMESLQILLGEQTHAKTGV